MYKETFHKRIKAARIEAGYTQKQTEDITGIPQNTISRIETGDREPNLETLAILAEFYDISTDWLLGIGKKKGS